MEIDDKYRDPIDLFTEIVLSNRETIYVCGYPRSGTTWITRLLAQCLDSPALSWSVKNDVRKPRFRDPAVEGLSRRGPYVVRHGHWKARQPEMRGQKVLVVHRDPRDVAVSCFHYFNFHKPDGGGIERCVGQVCGEKGAGLAFVNVDGRGWGGYTASWEENGAPSVRYEDMVQKPEEEIWRIARKLGVDVQVSVQEAVHEHTFAHRAKTNKDKTMRKGIAGGWRTVLPRDLGRRIEVCCQEEMERLEYL